MCRTILKIAKSTPIICLFNVIFFFPQIAAADSFKGSVNPPSIPFLETTTAATLSSPPITKVNLGGFGIELEKTELKDVLKNVGVGAIQHHGDAGDSESWICFTVSSATPTQRVWLASGEMGGEEHSAYLLYAETHTKAYEKSNSCPELPSAMKPISTDTNIWLGSTTNELIKVFGKPSKVNGNWWEFSYEGKVSDQGAKDAVPYNLSGYLVVKIVDAKVVTLFASKISSD
jgi:hypothetical protein